MNNWKNIEAFGQSLWYDNIGRSFLIEGGLAAMIRDLGVKGVTSNPTILEKAIATGREYDEDIRSLIDAGKLTHEIYEKLTTDDVRLAADILYDVYISTHGEDGYVSIEVDPTLAHNTEETIAQAKHLWEVVDRPNIMIKIPGTTMGLPAIRKTIADGINVNVTLLFGIGNYTDVAHAYIDGLHDRIAAGKDITGIRSVASFFLSRVDTNVDKLLLAKDARYHYLLGKAANANAKLAYQRYKEIFYGNDFADLHAAGAHVQRCLWASVSTKNPQYSDILYIEPLIGNQTVTTVPDETIKAFLDHGKAEETLERGTEDARSTIFALSQIGIDTEAVAEDLQEDGVKKFEEAFGKLLNVLDAKRKQVAEAVV